MTATVHLAPVVLPMTGPPVRDGAVAVAGDRVVAVGPRAEVPTDGARVREHAGVLLPGLVNAHAHLEHGPSFTDLAVSGLPLPAWTRELTRRRRGLDDTAWLVEARGSVHALLRTGTTCVADVVTAGPGLRAAQLAGLAGVSYVDVPAPDEGWPAEGWPAERARVERLLDGAGRAVGVRPPALHALSAAAFADAVALARGRGLRLHPHLAHEPTGTGAGTSQVRHADALGGLGPDVHVAPGVHADAADRALLRERGTAVALCTRSDAALGAGRAPVAAYLAEGSPVALGTGSLASTPDLDLLAEARAARDLALAQGADPAGLAEALVRAATLGGAAALGLRGPGTLAPGVRADLAVFDVPTEGDPYAALLAHGAGRCTATVLAGRLVHRR